MISIDRLIGALEAAKVCGATQVAVDVTVVRDGGWPDEADLPRVVGFDVIANADRGFEGQRIVVLEVEDLAKND